MVADTGLKLAIASELLIVSGTCLSCHGSRSCVDTRANSCCAVASFTAVYSKHLQPAMQQNYLYRCHHVQRRPSTGQKFGGHRSARRQTLPHCFARELHSMSVTCPSLLGGRTARAHSAASLGPNWARTVSTAGSRARDSTAYCRQTATNDNK